MVAEWSGTLLEWKSELASLKTRIGGVFKRSEGREIAGAFLDGLLSGAERKTGWLMAEQAGLEQPYRMQSLLGRGLWSADALRDIVRAYVFEEGRAFGGRGAPVFRRGGADRELSGRRVLGLCEPLRTGADRP
jgi:hypothetical protein